ncbi:hypothetical protein FRB90_012400 [Tulasnella sp. 427]|nr:hypothetical protein FRB90_012400 [Tulasnella sp. 427]
MLRTVLVASLIALSAVIYLPAVRETLSSKLFGADTSSVQQQAKGAQRVAITTSPLSASPSASHASFLSSYQDPADSRTASAPAPDASHSPDQPTSNGQQPLLPGPDEISSDEAVLLSEEAQLERLGPIIVNSDGTLSRIDNWKDMTPGEKALSLKRLKKRNE